MGLNAKQRAELQREKTLELYSFMDGLCPEGVAVGIDEVGRGALAGPLTVCALALPREPQVVGIDDSKRLSPGRRARLAEEIRAQALAVHIVHIPPDEIDAAGMGAALRVAMSRALAGISIDFEEVLIDGNPMHVHPKERCIVGGDGKVACIAAASIVAKVTRDALMELLDREYAGYGFASNKGYGSRAHRLALRELGPSPVHRLSFLKKILDEDAELM